MKRKLSSLEWALLLVPLLAFAVLAAREPLRKMWSRVAVKGIVYSGDWMQYAWSPDSRQIVVSSWDSKARIDYLYWFDVESQSVVTELENTGAGRIVWSPDGKHFARVGSSGCSIWDSPRRQMLFRKIVVGATDLTSFTWKSNTLLQMKDSRSRQISPPGVRPAKWSRSVTTYMLDISTQNIQNLSTVPSSSARRVDDKPSRLSPDGQWKVSISDSVPAKRAQKKTAWSSTSHEGQRPLLWNRNTGKLERIYEGDMLQDVAFLDNDTIVGFARLQTSSGMQIGPDAPPRSYVCTMKVVSSRPVWRPLDSDEDGTMFSPDAKLLVSRIPNGIRFRDTRAWRVLNEVEAKSFGSHKAEFSQNGRFLALPTQEQTKGRIEIISIPQINPS